MRHSWILAGAVAFAGTVGARADAPSVAVDIAPVHALVSLVMGDLGAPDLVMRPGASPHAYAMRPSEAAALQNAEAVFWIGHELTPWLERSIEGLSEDAVVVELLEVAGTFQLPFRELDDFGDDHDHADEHAHADEHDHDHGHGDVDPHAWLDPRNASVWVQEIAVVLGEIDPENATIYLANAENAQGLIGRIDEATTEAIDPFADLRFAVFHDAFHYFEARYGLTPLAAISLGDAAAPGPRHITHVREALAESGVQCLIAEPGYNEATAALVTEGLDIPVIIADQLGAGLSLGQTHYAETFAQLAGVYAACAQPKS